MKTAVIPGFLFSPKRSTCKKFRTEVVFYIFKCLRELLVKIKQRPILSCIYFFAHTKLKLVYTRFTFVITRYTEQS